MNVAERVLQLKTDYDEVKQAGYDKGYKKGYDDGYDEGTVVGGDTDAAYQRGIEDGKRAQVAKQIWHHNNQGNYLYAFAAVGWHDKTYLVDESAVLNGYGNCTDMYAYSYITDTIATIKVTETSSQVGNLFRNAKNLITIRKLVVSENTAAIGFNNCSKLENITFEGTIANNLNMQWCPLKYFSFLNIFSVLSDTTSGLTLTLNKAAVNMAFETWEDGNDGSISEEFIDLIATKPNWTITLA